MMPVMQLEHVTQISCRTDVVVIGTNPEMADYDNPRGHIFGYCGYIIADAPDGSRWVFDRTLTKRIESDVFARLDTLVAHMQRAVDNGRKLDPQHWIESRPCYGSEAYVNGGWAEEDYLLERQEAMDEGWLT